MSTLLTSNEEEKIKEYLEETRVTLKQRFADILTTQIESDLESIHSTINHSMDELEKQYGIRVTKFEYKIILTKLELEIDNE